MLRLAVLLSGSGRTLENLARARVPGVRITGVVSSNPKAYGLVRARRLGIPRRTVPPQAFRSRPAFWAATWKAVDAFAPDLVVMAGYLSYLRVPGRYAGRVLNIHPSLLPAFGGKGFYGMRVHRAVLEAGARTTGCTVHVVDDAYDHGPVLARARVPVRRGDTPERLAARVFRAECRLYPDALRRIARGALRLPPATTSAP